MLTKNEITALTLSPTKKDFVQIWNELLEVAGKLSERWDPTSTNESDPGIVILKALTGIADKLNYSIDKNTLEAFMPTAAQEDSMRKLCDMLGYNVKYYRSAETTVTFKYYNSDPSKEEDEAIAAGLLIPKFTTITNGDRDVNYFTINQTPYYISSTSPLTEPIPCMEGQIVKCESTTDNNVITASQISDGNRFYLPEYQIAENGIFVYNVAANQDDGDIWQKVDNLNVQARGSRVFKFGYDSYEGRPYLEFPEDYSELINDGLFIYYARTSGANGNISARTLTQFEPPKLDRWDKVSAESFSVENAFSAVTGSNVETISQAYNNFKKTVGTFETLVTCRDYMNKIYSMTDDSTGKYLVSNTLVTDIRTDLNRAVTICSCDDAGIFYKETPLVISLDENKSTDSKVNEEEKTVDTINYSTANKPVFNPNRSVSGSNWFLGSKDGLPLSKSNFIENGNSSNFSANTDGEVEAENGFWWIYQNNRAFRYKTILPVESYTSTTSTITKTVTNNVTITKNTSEAQAIDHFDLVLYPFKSYSQIKNNVKDIQAVYDKSFEYSPSSFSVVKNKLDQSAVKMISHNIIPPRKNDIISINNYLRLNAIIGTTSKITSEEGVLLVDKIKIALANAFNMRELDFGEEIPFDSILQVIENADTRISVVSLTEPALYTTFSVYEGQDVSNNPILREYAVASDWLTETYANTSDRFEYENTEVEASRYSYTFNTKEAKKIYNKLAVRNVLAGRVPLFKYNNTFSASFSEGAYRVTETITTPPSRLCTPDENNPFTIYIENGITYTAQWTASGIVYKKIYVPEEYAGNIIAKSDDGPDITKIVTSCAVKAEYSNDDNAYKVSDVTLSNGEYIKFRAPNFITNKTYPAYVNYHLKLSDKYRTAARGAKVHSLQDLFVGNQAEARRDAVHNYFANTGKKKTFTLVQTVFAKTDKVSNSITLKVDNQSLTETPSSILAKSGFVKLVSGIASLRNAENEAEISIQGISIPKIYLTANTVSDESPISTEATSYITNSSIFDKIKEIADIYLARIDEDILPNFDWTISYEFEYVPFEPTTLSAWEDFFKSDTKTLFGFSPIIERSTVLWRIYQGSYQVGKYVLDDGVYKILPFGSEYFGLLPENRFDSIYLAEDLGSDLVPQYISNDEEYMLRSGEQLYIEYTPSTTTEDGTSQTQEPVKEILGEGTIIKPSGFEGDGLIDSSILASQGNTAAKTVVFKGDSGTVEVDMFSLGASEQVAVRDFSKVTLDSRTLSSSPVVYVYKNFNNCKELETREYKDGKRVNSTYTLKDGEYIFYTDQNKAEFAYFTSGTEVTLTGRTVLSKREIIDIASIFDNGIQEIPWESKTFSSEDSIIFQEFQYITLGAEDTLNQLLLVDSAEGLSAEWHACDKVIYTPVGADESITLPKINVSKTFNNGNGWEVCSKLELSVSPNSSQTLRTTDNLTTSVTLYAEPSSGEIEVAKLEAKDSDHPISFKTNFFCQSSSNTIELDNIYTNPNNLQSFEFKIFAEQFPAIIKTSHNKLVPCLEDDIVDITKWPEDNDRVFNKKSYGELWTRVPLTYLTKDPDAEGLFDRALHLPVSILPGTYGVFCIYLNYSADFTEIAGITAPNASSAETWIDLIPGTSHDDITILNVPEGGVEWYSEEGSFERLKLKPGINCIRVNNTCELFIKTNSNSSTTSALYFDDLRLVDCQSIEYVENGEKKQQRTQGLNLDQIGYLDTSSTDPFDAFTMQIRKKMKEDDLAEALEAINAQAKLNDERLTVAQEALQESKDDLSKLVDFISNAKTEIDSLVDRAEESTIAELFAKYKELCIDLGQETSLKDALINNKNIDDVTKQLEQLLLSVGDDEASRQALLSELDALEQVAIANASNITKAGLSKGTVLDDFDATADSSDELLINDLKLFSLKEINAEYANKLVVLESAVSNVVDSEVSDKLLSILEGLNITKHSKIAVQIQQLVDKNQATLADLIAEIHEATAGNQDLDSGAYIVDYSNLRTLLVSLREFIAVADLSSLLTELELVSDSAMYNKDKYVELLSITKEMQQLLEAEGDATFGSYASIVSDLNTLIVSVQAKINNNTNSYDNTIVSSVDSLSQEVLEIFVGRLSSSLAKLKDILDDLEEEYTTAISLLKASEDDVVKTILDSLDNYGNARLSQVENVEAFATRLADGTSELRDIYISVLPYGISSVYTVWPTYMRRSYVNGVAKLYKDIRDVINTPSVFETLAVDDSFYTATEPKALRQVLATNANLVAFQQLFAQAKEQSTESTQKSKRVQLISTLGALITPTSKISSALEAIKADTDLFADRNIVLRKLITNWTLASTFTEKQRLREELSNELESVIRMDTQLVEISAKLLCPSILLFQTYNMFSADSAFFDRLKTYISKEQTSLLNVSSKYTEKLGSIASYLGNAHKVTDSLLTALVDKNISQFDYWEDISSQIDSKTLLTKPFLDSLINIKDILNNISQVAEIKSCKLIKLLSQDLVVAWQSENNGNWLDGTGEYYQKLTNYKDTSKPAEWVAYPLSGTTSEQNAWIKAEGIWSEDGLWKTQSGLLAAVNAKRLYETGLWVDHNDEEIVVKNSDSVWLSGDGDDKSFTVTDGTLNSILEELFNSVSDLGKLTYLTTEAREAHATLWLETQLLNEIQELDRNREFYYNVPVEANMAINFNEGDAKLNTLLNPATNYDINNVNNNFVMSKIDINYLTNGLQIARSSKLS